MVVSKWLLFVINNRWSIYNARIISNDIVFHWKPSQLAWMYYFLLFQLYSMKRGWVVPMPHMLCGIGCTDLTISFEWNCHLWTLTPKGYSVDGCHFESLQLRWSRWYNNHHAAMNAKFITQSCFEPINIVLVPISFRLTNKIPQHTQWSGLHDQSFMDSGSRHILHATGLLAKNSNYQSHAVVKNWIIRWHETLNIDYRQGNSIFTISRTSDEYIIEEKLLSIVHRGIYESLCSVQNE